MNSKLYKTQLQEIFKGEEKILYSLYNAINILKNISHIKFDETLELFIKLSINKINQTIRGNIILPHGTGRKKKIILVIVPENQINIIKNLDIDYVGFDNLINKIQSGWLDFDILLTIPEIMPKIRILAKILGPKGLMPSIRTGTLTDDIVQTVNDIRKGKVEIKFDKGSCVHFPVGKISFSTNKLVENCQTVIKEIIKITSNKIKNLHIVNCNLCTTMSPSIQIKLNEFV